MVQLLISTLVKEKNFRIGLMRSHDQVELNWNWEKRFLRGPPLLFWMQNMSVESIYLFVSYGESVTCMNDEANLEEASKKC